MWNTQQNTELINCERSKNISQIFTVKGPTKYPEEKEEGEEEERETI